jgi:fucose 4-O-acetylase-like acetyltransferase
MWFLTHLFAVFCFAYVLVRLTGLQDRPAPVQWSVIALMLIVGSQSVTAFWDLRVSMSGEDIVVHGLPFNSDILLLSGAFFLAGSFLRQQVLVFMPNLTLLLLAVLGFAAVVLFTDAAIDFNRRVYDEPLFATIGAICGIYTVLVIAFCLNHIPGLRALILMYGRASLFILIFHVYIGGVAFKAMTKYGPFEADNIAVLLVAFLASITLPVLIRRVVIGNAWLSTLYLPLNSRQTTVWRKRIRQHAPRAGARLLRRNKSPE